MCTLLLQVGYRVPPAISRVTAGRALWLRFRLGLQLQGLQDKDLEVEVVRQLTARVVASRLRVRVRIVRICRA